MDNPEPGLNTGVERSETIEIGHIAHLRARLRHAPATVRTHRARDFLRLSERYVELAEAMLDAGLDDRPVSRQLTWTQRLRLGLESGKFAPPNAAALLIDLDLARVGNREAKERVISYLESPGVLEALDDD